MLPAVTILRFDPNLEVGGHVVRWETLALAAAILVGILVAARLAGRANRSSEEPALRRDDLLYMVLGALPGAVVGGRILHGLDFYAFYAPDPAPLLDPARGSLSLLGAVLGGLLTAAYVGWLLGAPLRRWLDVALVPLLLVIALGKFANLLGGAGQGAPTDAPWAIAYAGDGPWRSLAAAVPAHPSQIYEGLWALAGIVLVTFLATRPVARRMPVRLRRPGLLFGLGLMWWALGRVVVGFSWRDAIVFGGLNMEQLAALAVLAGCLLVLLRGLRRRQEDAESETAA